jgi:hypothetical protein
MIKLDLNKIIVIINKANPLGLYEDDETNYNEFISEAKEIEKKINELSSKQLEIKLIQKIVNETFYSFFEGVEIKKEELDEISEKIFLEISKNNI